MARVIKPNEVLLNSVRYPIIGTVRPSLISQFPAKIVIGDYTKDTEQVASNWIVSDQRGGILIEEMDESVHADRSWWSTCNFRYRGHLILPVLVTDCGSGGLTAYDAEIIFRKGDDIYAAFGGYLRKYDNVNNDFNDVEKDFTYTPTDIIVYKDAIFAAFGDSDYIWQKGLPLDKLIRNNSFEGWYGGYPTDWTVSETGTCTITQSADWVQDKFYSYKQAAANGANLASISQSLPFSTLLQGKDITVKIWGKASTAVGSTIYIEDSVGTDATVINTTYQQFSTTRTINAAATYLKVRVDTNGAAAATEATIDLAEVTAITGFTDWVQGLTKAAYFAIWQDFLWKITTDGELYFTESGIRWVKAAEISAPIGEVTSLYVARDAAGDTALYVGTDVGVFVYDPSSEVLLQTDLVLPQHSGVAKRPTEWRGSSYIPTGLDILKYTPGNPATVTSVGLDKDDGLPAEYIGGIQGLIGGYNDLFALVDAARTGTDNHSSIMSFDGEAWQCFWASTADNPAVTFRAYGSSAGANSTSCTITKPVGLTAGDLMIAQIVQTSNKTITPPTGWTALQENTYSTTLRSSLFWKNADSNDVAAASFAFTLSATANQRGAISAWYGHNPLNPIDTSNGQGNAASTTVTSLGVTPSIANCEILMFCATLDDNTHSGYAVATSNPASWTERYDLLYDAASGDDLSLAIGGATRPEITATGSGTATTSGSDANIGQLVAITPIAQALKCGLISAAYDSYRLYFGANEKVYYAPLQQSLRNPLKIFDFPYAASGIHILPWFDAGWQNVDKLALSFKVYCKGMSATETAVVQYRLNHSYDDIDTGWTTLGTITADGETEYTFASGVGTTFSAIQFKFSLARGSTSTVTPDIQWFSLKYLKLLDPLWGWTFTVDCNKPSYGGKSPAQLIDAVTTAAETNTLLTFVFRNDDGGTETYKVKVRSIIGGVLTGVDKRGEFTVQVIEV